MTFQTWWLFVFMTFFISATPGPNMLLVMTTGARVGLRPALATMAGCMTALLSMLALSAAGMGALLEASPTVFKALRLAGAAYLCWLGVQLWRAKVEEADGAAAPVAAAATPGPLYRQGLLVAASNPKAILFAAAFFPQFIHADAPALPQFALLLATFSVIEVGWYLAYAASGERISRHLRRATFRRWFNRATGTAFIAFALLMADLGH